MDVAITGSSGLIGSALAEHLRAGGHRVVRVVRGEGTAGPDDVRWDPDGGDIDAGGLEGLHGVVHLAGESIGGGRWNETRKRRVLESRTRGTALLARALAGLQGPPAVLLSGSAIGYYGDRGDEELTEESGRGDGFLSDVVVAWEDAATPATEAGIRTVFLRSGLVLAGHGGVLKPQLPLFKAGLGGRLGSGRQWQSWISLPDEVAAIVHLLTSAQAGPVNLTGPRPVRQSDFAKTLGTVLRRPTVLPVPAFAPRLLLGREMADELLFASQRCLPTRLEADGYAFQHVTLEEALRAVL